MFYVSRFKDIESREYECEVVTPLFLGGADPKEAELRVPPVKAAMRFWWRALYEGTVEQMAKDEVAIFGSTEKKSAVSIQLSTQNAKSNSNNLPRGQDIIISSKGKTFPISIIEYLAFGLFDPKQKTNKYREYIEPKTSFKIAVTFPKNEERDVVKALKSLISFGGLGARSRNGFGSFHCDGLVDHTFKKEGDLKSFTSFSNGAILFDKFNTYNKWENALSEIGTIYRQARLKLEPRHTWNKRAFIAMPIEAKKENIPNGIRENRHAKPYFLHVSKTPGKKYKGQILFLPYRYKTNVNDTSNQVAEYLAVCKQMNDEIAKSMGGAK